MEGKEIQNKFNELLTNTKADAAYAQYLAYWNTQKGISPTILNILTEDLKKDIEFHEFARFEKSVKAVLDITNFRILFITDNIQEISGYTAKEILGYNIFLFFYSLPFDHLNFPLKTMQFRNKGRDTFKKEDLRENLKLTVCGLKMKRKDRSQRRAIITFKPLQMDELGNSQITLFTAEDITHLIKPEFEPYWCRMSCGERGEKQAHFISNNKTEMAQDIISEREKDVLRLLVEGLESKEIAQKLLISPNTVDNHRRNMIARTGARDTTALLQLCFKCGII